MRRTSNITKFFVLFLALAMLFTATAAPKPVSAQSIGITVSFGPPPIPYYVQPPDPYQNWIWSPGYWAYSPYSGYYWVPGTWVPAPQYGLLWTPGYWAWNGNAFAFSSGYWASEVGWYGGVDYGYGYYGRGYEGGRWRGHQFEYNTAVSNVNRSYVRNVYDDPGVVNHTWNRVSYNGGRGGVSMRPTSSELAVGHGRHYAPTNVQMQHARLAATNRSNFASVTHGRPATAAMARPYSSANRPAYSRPVAAHSAPRMAAPQHAAAMQHSAPAQHAYSSQHAAPQQHYAAPAQHTAPQHYAAQQQHAAPAPHAAAPVQHGGKPAGGGGGGAGGGGQNKNGH